MPCLPPALHARSETNGTDAVPVSAAACVPARENADRPEGRPALATPRRVSRWIRLLRPAHEREGLHHPVLERELAGADGEDAEQHHHLDDMARVDRVVLRPHVT